MSLNQTFASIKLPPSLSRPNETPAIDPALNHIYALFGEETLLVPAPPNDVEYMAVGCPDLTLEQTRALPYQAQLAREHIAVACGVSDLCAIFFVTPAIQEDFLKSNEQLRGTLITRGPLGTVLWLRCSGALTSTISLRRSQCWLGATEAVVVATRGDLEPRYTIVNVAKPVAVPFANIVWTEPMRIEIIFNSIAVAHEAPTIKDPKNRIIPSWNFWARSFAAIHHVGYDVRRDAFFQQPPGQAVQSLPNELVLSLLSDFLGQYGRQERFALLLKYRQQRFLMELLAMLRIVTAQTHDPNDDLEKFVVTALEACPGADVSSAELNAAHVRYFRAINRPPYPKRLFEKRMPAYIEQLVHGVHSRKIERGGKYCRGFTHVRIKQQGDG